MCNDCIMCINWVLFTWWMKKTKNNVSRRVCLAVVRVLLCQVGRSMVLGVHIESRFLVPHLVCLLIPPPYPCKASHSSLTKSTQLGSICLATPGSCRIFRICWTNLARTEILLLQNVMLVVVGIPQFRLNVIQSLVMVLSILFQKVSSLWLLFFGRLFHSRWRSPSPPFPEDLFSYEGGGSASTPYRHGITESACGASRRDSLSRPILPQPIKIWRTAAT